jgi:hypothetical protein
MRFMSRRFGPRVGNAESTESPLALFPLEGTSITDHAPDETIVIRVGRRAHALFQARKELMF